MELKKNIATAKHLCGTKALEAFNRIATEKKINILGAYPRPCKITLKEKKGYFEAHQNYKVWSMRGVNAKGENFIFLYDFKSGKRTTMPIQNLHSSQRLQNEIKLGDELFILNTVNGVPRYTFSPKKK